MPRTSSAIAMNFVFLLKLAQKLPISECSSRKIRAYCSKYWEAMKIKIAEMYTVERDSKEIVMEERFMYCDPEGRAVDPHDIELRYNHNHDSKGRFCSGIGGGRSNGGGKSGKSVDKSGKTGIIKTGTVSGGLIPDSDDAQAHAERYYESVRKMKTDVRNIAQNTGFSEEDISQIKNHVFVDEHDLGGDVPERFYPNYAMSQSWQRLIDGKNIQKHDITLLNHEKMESKLMKLGYSQKEAHEFTEKVYNYAKESREYYAEINKHRKE